MSASPPPEAGGAAPLVLLCTDDPGRGGVACYNHALLMALAAAGFRAACAQARADNPMIAAQREAGVRHHWLPYDAVGSDFSHSLRDMDTPRAIFEEARPSLVVFSDCCPASNLAARHAAMAMRIPFVIVVGFVADYLVEDSRAFLGVIARHFARACEVIAVSEDNLRLLRGAFGLEAGRGTVVHYGRPAEFFAHRDEARRSRLRAEWGIPEDAVVALTAARLMRTKGYAHQIAAIEQLERGGSISRNHFIWVGEGEQRESIGREIARRGWSGHFTLPGQRWDMPAWLDLADLYVLPSENEGMPLSVMEAMAKSLPVAASAVGGIPEELGDTGVLLPDPKLRRAEAVGALARTLADWTRDGDARRRAGAACKARAERLFREETMISKTLGILERALETRIAAVCGA